MNSEGLPVDQLSITMIDAFRNPACYSHPISEVSIVETHISWVILTGQYAYKIKKPVAFSFVDFSTLEKRRWFCEEEVRLNRRLAPEVYLGVAPLTGSPSAPRVDGVGVPFEFAVKMNNFLPGKRFTTFLPAKKSLKPLSPNWQIGLPNFIPGLNSLKDNLPMRIQAWFGVR